MQRTEQENKAANKVTLIGAAVNAVLGLLKIIFGLFFHSAALVADGIHSLSDLITDVMVVLILKISAKGPDEDHPWGHGHFEALGTVILGSILIAVAGAMAYDSTLNLIESSELLLPEWPVLVIAALSIAAKEWIYRYTLQIGKQIDSALLIANAWHSRTDALSSIVVFIGVAGAMAGFIWLDAVAALIVAVMVAKIGWDLSWSNLKQLLGTSIPKEDIDRYKEQILSIEGIINVHSFKTRTMGNKHVMELHIQVAPHLSASEGHYIGNKACQRLQDNQEIGHIIFHIDTYDDEGLDTLAPETALPSRGEITLSIDHFFNSICQEAVPYQLSLYYYDRHIDLEILLSLEQLQFLRQNGHDETTLVDGLKIELAKTGTPWLGTIYLAGGIKQ
ncbi:cation diffusion facilitator family transporter [Neptuniibacter sp. PT8_73]|uniref:cation diffusion facilitator family transporter n=1 Tax=unclassified Neptuniibacter TaxID=2630693 RepID=UPI0039F70905